MKDLEDKLAKQKLMAQNEQKRWHEASLEAVGRAGDGEAEPEWDLDAVYKEGERNKAALAHAQGSEAERQNLSLAERRAARQTHTGV